MAQWSRSNQGSSPTVTDMSHLWRQEGHPANVSPVYQKSATLHVGTGQV